MTQLVGWVETQRNRRRGLFEAGSRPSLREDLVYHSGRLDAGQTLVETLELVGQPHVVEAEQVQDRGVQVVHVHAAGRGVEAELVALTVGDAPFDAAAGQP